MAKYKVKDSHRQSGLFATEDIKKGEVIISYNDLVNPEPHRLSIQIDQNKHLFDPNQESDFYMNHHCEPNCWIDTQNRQFKALINIKRGTELNFNYNSTEAKISNPFTCWCGSENCQGEIKGFKFLSESDIKKMEPSTIAPFLIYS